MRGEPYNETKRSVWVSKDGKELDDALAMKLLQEQGCNKERKELINRLFGNPLGKE